MAAMKVWDGTAWQTVAPFSERASVYVGPDAPVGVANAGDLWWDTDDVMAVSGQELHYSQITATLDVTGPVTAPRDVLSGAALTYDGSPIIVEFYATVVQSPNGAGLATVISLWDGATDLGNLGEVYTGNLTNAYGVTVLGRRRIVPTAGTHTYRIRAWVNGGTGTIYAGSGGAGGAQAPAYLRITRA